MKPTVTLDMTEWKKAANELFQTSSRSMVDFVNGQALKVSILAIRNTKAASPEKIQRQLGVIGRNVSFKTASRGKNKGKTRTVKGDSLLASNDTLAHRILLARKKQTGEWGIKGETLDEKVQRFIRARVASINFIRAGWIPAQRTLWAVVKKKPKTSLVSAGVRQRGVAKGRAIPATFSLRGIITSEIVNTAMNTLPLAPSGKGTPKRTADEGLQKAVNESTKDMIAELQRRLQPDLKKVSAK